MNNKLMFISFVIMLIVIMLMFVFMIGFHNADNCANVLILNAELRDYNITYGENGVFIKDWDGASCYRTGMAMMLWTGFCSFAILLIILSQLRKA